MPKNTPKNRSLFCCDNLTALRAMSAACFDLIYLDPPFNKKKTFTAAEGSRAAGAAFDDIYRTTDIKPDWLKQIKTHHSKTHALLDAIARIEGRDSYTFCYLAYMAIRLIECQRVLKPTGALYLHCDQTSSHALKLLLDGIFGAANFRNEIIWHYTGGGRAKRYFSRKHDAIFCYAKTQNAVFNLDAIRVPYKPTSGYAKSGITAKSGKKYSPHPLGTPMDDVWDIPIVNPMAAERIGYPTQKPLMLLERIIAASCPAGGIILDPFCGSGTSCIAAERLGRDWVGMDISKQSYALLIERLRNEVDWGKDPFQENWVNLQTHP